MNIGLFFVRLISLLFYIPLALLNIGLQGVINAIVTTAVWLWDAFSYFTADAVKCWHNCRFESGHVRFGGAVGFSRYGFFFWQWNIQTDAQAIRYQVEFKEKWGYEPKGRRPSRRFLIWQIN